MPEPPARPAVHDPHAVREVVCDGPMNVQWAGNRATITFTHPRARPQPLLGEGKAQMDLVIAARIATSVENLIGLRDLLTRLFPPGKPAGEVKGGEGGGGTLH
jgi:hypothetical protein